MTHILKTDLSSLERRVNKKLVLSSLASLSLPGAGLSVIEDCSQLAALATVDLSNNLFATRESLSPLLAAPALASLDLRGCPVAALDNYRRWVVAHAPALRLLDGKEVTALERRYAYNLFPQLKPGAAPSSSSSSTSSSKLVADDLFGSGALPVPPKTTPDAAVPEFFAVSTNNSNSNNNSFFAVTPSAGGPTAPVVTAKKAAPAAAAAAASQDVFGVKKGLLDNDILNQHANNSLLDNVLDVASVPKPAPAPGRDVLLDNDVLGPGKSFLEQKTKTAPPPSNTAASSNKTSNTSSNKAPTPASSASSLGSSSRSVDIASMFFRKHSFCCSRGGEKGQNSRRDEAV